MAREKENEMMERESTESDSIFESSKEMETDGKDNENSAGNGVGKTDFKERSGFFASISKHKWFLLFSLLIIFSFTGLGLKFSPELLKRFAMEKHVIALSEIKDENLKEEVLDPFFIPLSPESQMTVVRVDLSVICDGLASVLFRKKELQIRDQLYRDITTLADETDDLESMVEFLEMRISMTFKEILGLQNLVVRIKEIKYF